MRNETTEAFAHLVATFIPAIEDTGTKLPDDFEQQLCSNPLKACEILNELAVSCCALNEQQDAALAALYESMDAHDARTTPDADQQARLKRAFARAHREQLDIPDETEAEQTGNERAYGAYDQQPLGQPGVDFSMARTLDECPEPQTSREPHVKHPGYNVHNVLPTSSVEEESVAHTHHTSSHMARDNDTAHASHEQSSSHAQVASCEQDATDTSSEQASAPVQTSLPVETDANEQNTPQPQSTHKEQKAHAAAKSDTTQTQAEDDDDVLTVDQTIAILGLSRPTIYKMIDNGTLPAFKRGRSWQISSKAVAKVAKK